MRKNIFLLGALLAVSAATMAQTKQGGISAQMLSQIEKMQKTSAADKALFNAIAANCLAFLPAAAMRRSSSPYSRSLLATRRLILLVFSLE